MCYHFSFTLGSKFNFFKHYWLRLLFLLLFRFRKKYFLIILDWDSSSPNEYSGIVSAS